MTLHALADQIAAEHCAWARSQGMRASTVIRGLGASCWCYTPTWDETTHFVARLWLRAMRTDESSGEAA